LDLDIHCHTGLGASRSETDGVVAEDNPGHGVLAVHRSCDLDRVEAVEGTARPYVGRRDQRVESSCESRVGVLALQTGSIRLIKSRAEGGRWRLKRKCLTLLELLLLLLLSVAIAGFVYNSDR